MDRRMFTQLLAAGGLVGSTRSVNATTKISQNYEDNRPDFLQRLRLRWIDTEAQGLPRIMGSNPFARLSLFRTSSDADDGLGYVSSLSRPMITFDANRAGFPRLANPNGAEFVGYARLTGDPAIVADIPPGLMSDPALVVSGGRSHMVGDGTAVENLRVPFLTDLPIVGRMFRSREGIRGRRNLIIFITPVIVDPADA